MRLAAGILLFACGCGSGPYGSFDAGYDVHVIVTATPTPVKGLTVRPVVTLGGETMTAASRVLKGKDARAVEVAILLAPKGKHKLTVQEPTLKIGGSIELDVDRETWVVMEMRHGDSKGRFHVYEYPDDVRDRFVPLVPVPD
ncbi:MAG TPA: hypothetical protein VFY93_19215 [Planctomycetota bacterium]|nr:hypothetical protein [Planctomycetota bacterium]